MTAITKTRATFRMAGFNHPTFDRARPAGSWSLEIGLRGFGQKLVAQVDGAGRTGVNVISKTQCRLGETTERLDLLGGSLTPVGITFGSFRQIARQFRHRFWCDDFRPAYHDWD